MGGGGRTPPTPGFLTVYHPSSEAAKKDRGHEFLALAHNTVVGALKRGQLLRGYRTPKEYSRSLLGVHNQKRDSHIPTHSLPNVANGSVCTRSSRYLLVASWTGKNVNVSSSVLQNIYDPALRKNVFMLSV